MKIIFETGWTGRLQKLYEIVAHVYSTSDEEWQIKLSMLIPDQFDKGQLKMSLVFRNPIICLLFGITFSLIVFIFEFSYKYPLK